MKHIAWNCRSILRMTPLAAASLMLLSACSNMPPSSEQLAVSKAAVERASASSAIEAPTEFAMARDKLERANIAFANMELEEGRHLAEQAEADAALAEAQARAVRANRALTEVRKGIHQLREDIPQS